MARLIEIQSGQRLPAKLNIRVGDALLFHATGGQVQSGAPVMEALGPFSASALSDVGEVLTALGGPDSILFVARRTGRCRIKVMTGDPWRGGDQAAVIQLLVDP
jgi:hypothetical protein